MENQTNHQRPSWDEYFINIVKMIGERGTCDRGRSGCVITRDKRIISTGYVGAPAHLPHCDEVGHEMHTVTHSDEHQSRHCIRTSHAEENAIIQAARYGIALEGATVYCKMTPCYTCAKMVINAGIKRIVCAQDYHASSRSKEILATANIELVILSSETTTYTDQSPTENTNNQPQVSQPTTEPTQPISNTPNEFDISKARGFGQRSTPLPDVHDSNIVFENIINKNQNN